MCLGSSTPSPFPGPSPQGQGQSPQGYPQGQGQSPQGYPQGQGQSPQGYPQGQGQSYAPQGRQTPQNLTGRDTPTAPPSQGITGRRVYPQMVRIITSLFHPQ